MQPVYGRDECRAGPSLTAADIGTDSERSLAKLYISLFPENVRDIRECKCFHTDRNLAIFVMAPSSIGRYLSILDKYQIKYFQTCRGRNILESYIHQFAIPVIQSVVTRENN